jgi:hypothetical protein
MQFVTTNTKMEKGEGRKCFGVQLAPYRMSGFNVCPMASHAATPENLDDALDILAFKGRVCVIFPGKELPTEWHSYPVVDNDVDDHLWERPLRTVLGVRFKGRQIMKDLGCAEYCKHAMVQQARIRRTQLLMKHPAAAVSMIHDDIANLVDRHGDIAMRLNCFSDLPWERRPFFYEGKTLMARFPMVQFYDYTKNRTRMYQYLRGEMPPNYMLVFSYNKVWFEK